MGLKQSRNNILIFGGYSHENRGDHAMLIGLVEYLKRIDPHARLIIYSTDPEKIRYFLSVQTIWSPEIYFFLSQRLLTSSKLWFKKLIILIKGIWFILNFFIFKTFSRCLIRNNACPGFYKQLLEAKSLVLSGGGYLNSIWALTELYPKAIIVLTAKLSKVPVVMRSQTIGPFTITSKFDKFVAKLTFNSVTSIGLRDMAESKNCLHELGVKNNSVIFTGDDSLLLPKTNGIRLEEIISREKIPLDKRLIGVNFRNPGSYGNVCREIQFDLLARLMDKIAFTDEVHLVFLPISYNKGDDDRITAEKIQSRMTFNEKTTIVTNHYNADELKGLVSSLHAAIGISYHFLLFALSSNVSAIGLFPDEYYRRKNMGLFELYSLQTHCLSLNMPDAGNVIVHLIDKILSDGLSMVKQLEEKNRQIEEMINPARQALAGLFGNVVNIH